MRKNIISTKEQPTKEDDIEPGSMVVNGRTKLMFNTVEKCRKFYTDKTGWFISVL